MSYESKVLFVSRIQGALANLGHIIAPNTVKNILKRHGIEPAPEREKRTSWVTFLKAHWDVMAATVSSTDELIQYRERLGGMLNYYYREAA
jgi:hypothetical protein